MNKTLFGLAYINYQYELKNKDLIDSYIPLICKIALKKRYNEIDREQLQVDFNEEYGMILPIGVIETVLKRMVKSKIVNKNIGSYRIDLAELEKLKFSDEPKNLENDYITIVREINNFSIENYQISFSQNEIEDGFLAFLKEYDLDLLFASDDQKIISFNIKESRKVKYIISKYILNLISLNDKKYDIILKIAKGYAIASLITYKDISNYSGNLSKVDIYLDAPILYNVLGLNGDANILLTKELLNSLNENGGNLKVFNVHYSELINSLTDAVEKLRTKSYDISKSSRLIKTAVRENISSSSIQLKINQLNEILSKYNIEIESPIFIYSEDKAFQINENKLQSEIENLYNSKNGSVPWYISNQIENDVQSIANIFKIRKATIASSLKNCKAILLTNNEMIAYVAKRFEKDEWVYKSTIPVCLTDIFMSTILWANYPISNESLNIKRLMCECYYVTDLDNKIIRRYYEDIQKMHIDNTITDEQFHLLNASNLAYELLEKRTLNDIELYASSTPREILDEIEGQYKEQIQTEKNINEKIFSKIDRFSNLIGKGFFILISVLLTFSILLVKFYNPNINEWIYYPMLCLAVFLAIFGVLRWAEVIPNRKAIEQNIAFNVSKLIKAWLIK